MYVGSGNRSTGIEIMANEIIKCCISGRKYFIFNCQCIQATRNNTRCEKCMMLEFNKQSVRNGALGNGDTDLVFSNLRNLGNQRGNMQAASA